MASFPSPDADRPAQPDRFSLRLTPQGRLLLAFDGDAPVLDQRVAGPLVEAFARGSGHGLAYLGAAAIQGALPPVFVWWRDFAARFVAALCVLASGAAELPVVPPPTEGELATLALTAPLMPGAEYLTVDVLSAVWSQLGDAFAASLAASGIDLPAYLKMFWAISG